MTRKDREIRRLQGERAARRDQGFMAAALFIIAVGVVLLLLLSWELGAKR